MTSLLRHQPDDRVDLKPGMPKIRTRTVTGSGGMCARVSHRAEPKQEQNECELA